MMTSITKSLQINFLKLAETLFPTNSYPLVAVGAATVNIRNKTVVLQILPISRPNASYCCLSDATSSAKVLTVQDG